MVELALNYRYCDRAIREILVQHLESTIDPLSLPDWNQTSFTRSYGLPPQNPPPAAAPAKIPLKVAPLHPPSTAVASTVPPVHRASVKATTPAAALPPPPTRTGIFFFRFL